MPVYQITAPDGRKLRVTAPEGATQEDALAYAQQQLGQQPAESKQQKYERLRAELEARQPSDPMHPSNNPTTGMSGVSKIAAGAGKSVADMWQGLQQLTGFADEQDVAERRRLDAPLMGTGAGKSGYILGTLASIVTPGGALKVASKVPSLARYAPALNVASRAFLPTTARGAVAQGAAIGALQPTVDGESRTLNAGLGGAAGGIGVLVPRAIGAGYRAARNTVTAPTASGAQREAVRTIRSLVDDPAKLMTPAPSAIPGVRRTLFEESLVPGVARLETKARGANGDFWANFDAANDTARQAAIGKFAGDEAALSVAQAARSKATNPLYAQANKVAGVDTSRLVSQIKRLEKGQGGRPAVQRGLADVRNLLVREVPEQERKRTALAAMQQFLDTGRKSGADFDAAKAAMSAIRRGDVPKVEIASQAGRDALKAAQKAMKTTQKGVDDMQTIANVRLTIGDMLAGKYGGDTGQALAGSRALMAVKGQLDRVAAKASPEFAQATQSFRTMSQPINRMQAGQELLRRGTSAVTDPISGMNPLQPGRFGGQVKNLDALVQGATGFRKARAGSVFRPEDLQTIGAVNDDLSRSAARLKYGNGGGSHTASQAEIGFKLAGKALFRKLPWLGGAVEYLDAAAQDRVAGALAEMLANPAEYRRISAALPLQERMLVQQAFSRIGGTTGAASPALVNGLAE